MHARVPLADVEAIERPVAMEEASAPALGGLPSRVLALQRASGNRAVARLLARATWGKEYGASATARLGQSFEKYKSQIGRESFAPELKAASAWGKHTKPVRVWLTIDELEAIIRSENPSPQAKQENHNRLLAYLPIINGALMTMGIDTVEAQASFFAHAGESGSFAKLEEELIAGQKYAYPPEFRGRGPVQVTFEAGYVQSLAYLELRADQLEQEAKTKSEPEKSLLLDQATKARAAVAAIQANSSAAKEAEYGFLLSAAYMHWTKGVKRSSELHGMSSAPFAGAGAEDAWVTGWTESFQTALKLAPDRQKKAEKRLEDAQARLASASNADERKKAEDDVKQAQQDIQKQIGTKRDAPNLIERAKVKKAIYERAWRTLANPSRDPNPPGATPSGTLSAQPQQPPPAATTTDQPAAAAASTPAPAPTAAKRPSRLRVDVHVITTSSGPGDDEVYILASGAGGVHKTPVSSMGDGDRHTFELPAKIAGDGTQPISIKVFDEDWPSADDLLVWLSWSPPFGLMRNAKSHEGSNYKVTLSSD